MTFSLGENLKKIRLAKNVSLEEIAKNTHIRLSLLEAIEQDDFSEIPSKAQAQGFIRLICNYLKINITELNSIEEKNEQDAPALPISDAIKEEARIEFIESKQEEIKEVEKEKFEEELVDIKNLDKKPEIKVSEKIFLDIGNKLFNRRNLLNLPLEIISEQIKVKKEYLEALEDGKAHTLLSTVQAKGYLQNYSNYLELDTDNLLISFADGLQKRRIENINYDTSKKTTKIKSSSFFIWIRKFFTVDLFFGSVLIIGILAFLIWGTRNLLTSNNNQNQNTETLPNVADVLVVTPEAIFEETPLALELETLAITQQATYTATPLFTPLPNEPKIQVVIIAIQDAWVKVSSDGELKYQGRITPGNAYTYNAENQLEIITGNAAALQILFNQEDIGILGLTGQVMSLVFNENGLIKPTEIITQTPTATIQSTSSTPTP